MKTKTTYICELCGHEYDEESDARGCEDSHAKIASVVAAKSVGYIDYCAVPIRVIVTFTDGRKEVYEHYKEADEYD